MEATLRGLVALGITATTVGALFCTARHPDPIVEQDLQPLMYRDSGRVRDITWSQHPSSPILERGPEDAWNAAKGNTGQSVISVGGRWWLIHSGQARDGRNRIGVSISDGSGLLNWTTEPEPILDVSESGRWDSVNVAHPSVLIRSGTVSLYFSGQDQDRVWRIGLAKSGAFPLFVRESASAVFTRAVEPAWDDGGVAQPSVIHDGTQYVMAYAGWRTAELETQAQIGLATSLDGTNWSRHPANPILGRGRAGAWDDFGLLAPQLWTEGDGYFLMYSGKDSVSQNSTLGHAWAADLGSWSRKQGPLIPREALGSWREIEWGTPVKVDDEWFLLAPAWFNDGSTTLWNGSESPPSTRRAR